MKTEKTEIPQHVAMKWCWDNGISIYPVPQISNGKVLKICLNKNGVETIGKEVFDNSPKIYEKIIELYRAIYKKNAVSDMQ